MYTVYNILLYNIVMANCLTLGTDNTEKLNRASSPKINCVDEVMRMFLIVRYLYK